jgi:Holliday junction resolvase
MPPPRRFLPAAKTEFTERTIHNWANGKVNQAVVVEVKSRVKREAIAQLIEQVQRLLEFVPELSGKTRIGILAGIDWDQA